ncbi:hypothetical protein FLONG3_9004 [Fusarium longipes]|uniref:Infection structure specific n=1 Tax=Fusarium longipes TaxID=694270 RepID=A0A395S1C0_9HYPO|nr:hypothetical protein FLONG3_9004 [Fusarium longipes]
MAVFKLFILVALSALQIAAQTPTPTPTPTTSFSISPLTTPSCWALADSLPMTGMPVPPEDMSELVVSFAIGTLYNTADPCQLPVVTGSNAENFSSWASEWTSWQAQHVSEYRIIWESCSDAPDITDLAPVGPDACSTIREMITGTAAENDKDDKGEDNDEDNDDEPEQVNESSASRPTRLLLATLLAVCVFGVAI